MRCPGGLLNRGLRLGTLWVGGPLGAPRRAFHAGGWLFTPSSVKRWLFQRTATGALKMSNRTRKQWIIPAAALTLVVLINLWMSYMNASTDRLLEEEREKAERRLEDTKSRYEQAINERSLD